MCMNLHKRAPTCMHVYACVCTFMHVYACICTCMHVHACICTHLHVYVCKIYFLHEMLVINSKSLYLFCQFYGWNTKIDAKVKRKFGWCYDTQMWLLGAYPKPQNFAPKSIFPYIYLRDHVKTFSHSLYEDAFACINALARAYMHA